MKTTTPAAQERRKGTRMARLISIHDIDEFAVVKAVPDAAITPAIISSVRELHEIDELERFLREILYDPNDTPHGPTEIADILSTHVRVKGSKRVAGFVLKGRSFKKVHAKHVTHQFAKLRTIPDLGLMVFLAIGDIQDDAQRDFIQAALDEGCDYLIVDAHDCARLLIAYEKICPQDGTPFAETGACSQGHLRDEGIPLVMKVREKRQYTVRSQQDVSHAGAKRYSATVLLDRHYPREVVKDIVVKVTKELRKSCYYRNDMVKARWGNTPAHVVWLFVAYDLADIQTSNWVCRSSWIDEQLSDDMRPIPLDGDERIEEIDIKWNSDYQPHKEFYESHQGTKEEVVNGIQSIRDGLRPLAEQAIQWFSQFEAGEMSEEQLTANIQATESTATEIYDRAGNLPMPPDDTADYDEACQGLFGTIHDLFLYYSVKGIKTWPQDNRRWLMANTIKRFYEDLRRVDFEEEKLH